MNQNAIPDEKLKKFLQVLCNVWFEKWKRRKNMMDDEWSQCIHELDHIMLQGKGFSIVEELSMAMLKELDRRSKVNGDWNER